jgi:hypothetical protein
VIKKRGDVRVFFGPNIFFAAIKNAPVITDWGG